MNVKNLLIASVVGGGGYLLYTHGITNNPILKETKF